MGNIFLPVPMLWVTEIKDVRCERKNHSILTLRMLRKVTYCKWYLDFCDEACGFYIRPTLHWCVIGTLSQICGIVIMLGKWNFQRHAKKLNWFHPNCMGKLLKIPCQHFYWYKNTNFLKLGDDVILVQCPFNCMRKLFKIKWKDKIITFIYIIP